MVTAFLTSGAVGLLLFVVVFTVDGATRPGYRPGYHPVSALALGPRGRIQTANFVVAGVSVMVGAAGLFASDVNVLLGVTVGVFGAGLVASGVFPMDPMRGYPPGTSAGDPPAFTTAHRHHDNAGAVVFLSLPVAALIAGLTGGHLALQAYSLATAVGFFAAFQWFAKEWENDGPRAGLAQRIAIVSGWIWLAALLLHVAHGQSA